MTCADCDLSGRCPCIMRRLERLRAKGLIQQSGVDVSPGSEAEQIATNEELFESAMQLLRDLNKL